MSLSQKSRSGNGAGEVRQLSLFPTGPDPAPVWLADPCAAKHQGAETSIQAHERIKPHKREIYNRILAIIRARGSATVHELAAELQTYPSNISGRLTEMRGILGLLQYKVDPATGTKVKRKGACVLVIAE